MNKIIIFFLIILNISKPCSAQKFLTWEPPSGRTGDQLLTYCKAKWASEYLHIPLLIQNYPGFEKLAFFDKEKKIDGFNLFPEQTKVDFKYVNCTRKGGCQVDDFSEENTLFITDFNFFQKDWIKFDDEIQKNRIFPYNLDYNNSYREKGINSHKVHFDRFFYAIKKNQPFSDSLKKLIHLKKESKNKELPKNMISIALHVRKGGGYDFAYKSEQEYSTTLRLKNYSDFFEKKDMSNSYARWRKLRNATSTKERVRINRPDNKELAQPHSKEELYSDVSRPLKHPPDQFYIDQLKMLVEMIHAPIYCFIFTDDPHPADIADRYKRAINSSRVTFDFRKEKNSHSSNVLEDMFAMSRFDCLIRPYSSLSQTAQLIGNHKIVISPAHAIWFKNNLIIDEVSIHKNNAFDTLLKKSKEPITRP